MSSDVMSSGIVALVSERHVRKIQEKIKTISHHIRISTNKKFRSNEPHVEYK